jgi:hypothetical protein
MAVKVSSATETGSAAEYVTAMDDRSRAPLPDGASTRPVIVIVISPALVVSVPGTHAAHVVKPSLPAAVVAGRRLDVHAMTHAWFYIQNALNAQLISNGERGADSSSDPGQFGGLHQLGA